jgi:hypothetical protein
MAADDGGILKIGTEVDLSRLQSGMAEAQARVTAASAQMAEAQSAFGKAAAQGSEQAAAALKFYQTELASAQSALSGFTATEEQETVALRSNISARMAASAELRLLEGNLMGSTRAAGAFLSTTLGLGPVLQAAFPIFGALALADVLGQMINKVVTLIEDAATFREAWTNALKIVAEQGELQVRIWEKTSQLQHEAAVREHPLGAFAQDTIDAQRAIEGLNGAIQKQAEHIADLRRRQAERAPNDWLYAQDQRSGSFTPEIDAAQAKLETLKQQLGEAQQELGKAKATLTDKQAEADKKAANAARESLAQRLAFEQETGRLIDEEARKEEQAYKQAAAAAREHLNQVSEYTRHVQSLMKEDDRASQEYHRTYEEGLEKVAESQAKAKEIQDQQNASITEASIAFQVATGQMSRLAAAHALAAVHADEYRKKLADLRAELERINADQNLTQTQKNEKGQGVQNQITQVSGQQQTTAIADATQQAQLAAQPWINAATQIEDAWVGAFNKILEGGRQSWQAGRKAAEQMTMALIQDAEKWVEKKLEGYLRDEIAYIASQIKKSTADATAASTQISLATSTAAAVAAAKATEVAGNAATAQSFAGLAAVEAAAEAAPAGPVAAIVAGAEMYAAISPYVAMASFDTGGIIPKDGMIMAHEKEAVLPAQLTSFLMTAAGGGSQTGQAKPGIRDINFSPTYHSNGNAGRASIRDFHKVLRQANLIT